jgi:tungstate transport system ATP-binding protein
MNEEAPAPEALPPLLLTEEMRAPSSPLPLVLTGLSYRAGATEILSDLSIEIEEGPRTVILGPNGAGKSVLLRICHGLLRPSAGRIEWRTRRRAARRHAMVFQRPIMLRRTTLGNVAYGLKLAGVWGRERRRRALAKLEAVGLAHLAERSARSLSGGEQQRVALARAWALEPAVLFLDEPTANLDPSATRLVESVIEAMHRSGTKIIMTTHDLGQAHRIADEVIFLDRGRIAERAPAHRFFAEPQSAAAAAFVRGDLPLADDR